MNRKGFPDFVLSTMKNLNMVMILYLTMVTVHSLYGYVDGNSAVDFLMQVKRMPMEPWKLSVLSIGLYVCLLLLLSIHCQSKRSFLVKTVLELGVVFLSAMC